MTLRPVNNEEPERQPEPCEVFPECPVCGGHMEKVFDRHHQKVCVCVDCHTGLTIPPRALNVARMKRDASNV